jgi:hypothetical protein
LCARDLRKNLVPVSGALIAFAAARFLCKHLGLRRHLPFNLLIQTGKEFAYRPFIHHLIRQGGFQTRHAKKQFMPAYLPSGFSIDQKCDIRLGKSQAFSVCDQKILKLRRSHVVEAKNAGQGQNYTISNRSNYGMGATFAILASFYTKHRAFQSGTIKPL